MLPRKVFCHVHFPDVFQRLIPYILRVKPSELIITHTTQNTIDIPDSLSNGIKIEQISVKNQGRDTLPLFLLAKKGYFQQEAVIWRFHTKKSLHLLNGSRWLHELVDPLARDQERVSFIQDVISGGSVDLVGAKAHTQLSTFNHLREHRDFYDRWCSNLGIVFHSGRPYVAGTVFATHSRVLAKLSRLDWEIDEFPVETTPKFSLSFKLLLLATSNNLMLRKSTLFDRLVSQTRPSPGITYALEAFISNLSTNYLPLE